MTTIIRPEVKRGAMTLDYLLGPDWLMVVSANITRLDLHRMDDCVLGLIYRFTPNAPWYAGPYVDPYSEMRQFLLRDLLEYEDWSQDAAAYYGWDLYREERHDMVHGHDFFDGLTREWKSLVEARVQTPV